jgi:hypothetical protein
MMAGLPELPPVAVDGRTWSHHGRRRIRGALAVIASVTLMMPLAGVSNAEAARQERPWMDTSPPPISEPACCLRR